MNFITHCKLIFCEFSTSVVFACFSSIQLIVNVKSLNLDFNDWSGALLWFKNFDSIGIGYSTVI